MVVAVGLTLVEPLSDAEVNVPGVIAMLVAPLVVQLNVLLEPELMPVGFAVNEEIAGAAPFPEVEPKGVDDAQFSRATQANKMTAIAQGTGALSLSELFL